MRCSIGARRGTPSGAEPARPAHRYVPARFGFTPGRAGNRFRRDQFTQHSGGGAMQIALIPATVGLTVLTGTPGASTGTDSLKELEQQATANPKDAGVWLKL